MFVITRRHHTHTVALSVFNTCNLTEHFFFSLHHNKNLLLNANHLGSSCNPENPSTV